MSLFIGCLPRYDFDDIDLKDIFSKYGPIAECKVLYGSQFGYGFVDYENSDDMHEAMRNEHGRKIDGVRIVVEKAIRDKDSIRCYSCGKHGHTARNCWENYRNTSYNYDSPGNDDYHRDSYRSRRREGREDDDYYYQSKNRGRRDDDDDEYYHRSRGHSRRDDDYHRHSYRSSSNNRRGKEEDRYSRHSRSPRRRRCTSDEDEKEAKKRHCSSPTKDRYEEEDSYYLSK